MSKQTDITISRSYFSDMTLGRLRTKSGFDCWTYELPYLGNISVVETGRDFKYGSCIEEGLYDYEVRRSPGSGQMVIWLLDTPGRENIQIHIGNTYEHTDGCILPGHGIADINGDGVPDVVRSGDAMKTLLDSIPKKGKIRIIENSRQGRGVYLEDG